MNSTNNEDFIYLLQEREFIKEKEPIYKLGRTRNPSGRISSYPKGSRIYFLTKCNDCKYAEGELLTIFRNLFVPRKDIGNEYFLGSLHDMLRILYHFFVGEFE